MKEYLSYLLLLKTTLVCMYCMTIKKKATFRIVVHYNMSTFTCSTHISSTAAVLVRGRNCIFMTKVLFQDAAAYIRYSVISSIPFFYTFLVQSIELESNFFFMIGE